MAGEVIAFQSVEEAFDRVRPYVKRTPVLTSSSLNDLTGKSLHFKCENLQVGESVRDSLAV
jgi:threonine dehydratase